jgi:hypothetical protein
MNNDELKEQMVPLSLRALGLLGMFQDANRVIPTNELKAQVKEGRDAINKAKRELRAAGYVKTIKSQVNGQWSTTDRLTEPSAASFSTDSG